MTTTLPKAEPRTRPEVRTEPPKMWNVVLLDDDEHSYEYVMLMVQDLFGFGLERAFSAAKTVDTQGRVVCLTTHKEHAELKCEQIHGYGADPRIMGCMGSMSAIIEPAEFEGDGDGGGSDGGS